MQEKVAWQGTLVSVQPRIRLMRSFDQRSHSYLGYVLRIQGMVGDEECEFAVGIGKAAHAKYQFRTGDVVSGKAQPVADEKTEPVDFYKASGLKVIGLRGVYSRGQTRYSCFREEDRQNNPSWGKGSHPAADAQISPAYRLHKAQRIVGAVGLRFALGERQIRIYHPHPALTLATARCAGQGEGTVESAVRLSAVIEVSARVAEAPSQDAGGLTSRTGISDSVLVHRFMA